MCWWFWWRLWRWQRERALASHKHGSCEELRPRALNSRRSSYLSGMEPGWVEQGASVPFAPGAGNGAKRGPTIGRDNLRRNTRCSPARARQATANAAPRLGPSLRRTRESHPISSASSFFLELRTLLSRRFASPKIGIIWPNFRGFDGSKVFRRLGRGGHREHFARRRDRER